MDIDTYFLFYLTFVVRIHEASFQTKKIKDKLLLWDQRSNLNAYFMTNLKRSCMRWK